MCSDGLESREKEPVIPKNVPPTEKSNLNDGYFRGDGRNVALLLLLYGLQGVPLGLTEALPTILQSRNINYSDQAEFSFCSWPFAMKLLWAPVVDAVYSPKFGKRKSWFIPSQILLGFLMIFISRNIDNWLGDETGSLPPNIEVLTVMFFLLNFLTATQDIAVDGWALTMLRRENLGYISTCNSIGQVTGKIFGGQVFIFLTSANFSNAYLFWLRPEPQPTGIVSFSTYIFFWAIVFLISTTMVGIFKKDNSLDLFEGDNALNLNLQNSYYLLWKILKLKPIQYMAMINLTAEMMFAPSDTVAELKLVENGVPRDKIAMVSIPMIPLAIILPIIINRYVLGSRPLDCYVAAVPFRLVMMLLYVALVYVTPSFRNGNVFPFHYYGLLFLVTGFDGLFSNCQSLGNMAFMARVSDPRCGATYMAFLATIANLGRTWPSSVILWLVDVLTWKKCVIQCIDDTSETCEKMEICSTYLDGYFVEVILCIPIGIVWLLLAVRTVDYLQKLDRSAWLVDASNYQSTEKQRTHEADEVHGEVAGTNRNSTAYLSI